jgi:hypothetical protein
VAVEPNPEVAVRPGEGRTDAVIVDEKGNLRATKCAQTRMEALLGRIGPCTTGANGLSMKYLVAGRTP